MLIKAADSAEKRLVQAADNDPDWSALAPALAVVPRSYGLEYMVMGDEDTQAMASELEYGGPTSAPSPLIRNTVGRDEPILRKLVIAEVF